MNKKLTTAVAAFLLLSGAFSAAWGQQSGPGAEGAHQVDAAVYFRIGESSVDPDFEGNRIRLIVFLNDLRRIQADSNYVISRIEVAGTASPDGARERNEQLAGERAEALASWLVSEAGIPSGKISVVNGGENWTGLRAMIEASEMPCKADMLRLMDRYPDDRDARKRAMQYYAGSEPWLWMFDRFFPALRMGAGGTEGHRGLSTLSRENWQQVRGLIQRADMDDRDKRLLLEAIDRESDPALRMECLREVTSGTLYDSLQRYLVRGLLNAPSALTVENWTVLRERIAADTAMPLRQEVLRLIDSIPVAQGREAALLSLGGGTPYRYIFERHLPELLSGGRTLSQRGDSGTPGAGNWHLLRSMAAASEMPLRDSVLLIIDSVSDPAERMERLRSLDGGYTFTYINEVFFPELLYGISDLSQENWELLTASVEGSDMPYRDDILAIIRTTAPGPEREAAIRALDGGESWRRLGDRLLPELLQHTETVQSPGSGMTFYYELSPAAKARAAAMTFRKPPVRPAGEPRQPESAAESGGSPASWRPLLALKTDLLPWAGVAPGFERGAFMPNLALEVYFARRWSVDANALHANRDYSGGGKLWAVTSLGVEPRFWIRNDGTFRGLYVGAYGQFGQFDNQQNKTAGTDNRTGTFWSAGLSAGWLQPLSRHWAVEVGVRGGYRSASFDWYDIERDGAGAVHSYFNRSDTQGKFVPGVRVNVMYRFGKPGK